jgi:hypothetical protein
MTITIIGAGMAGLLAGNLLRHHDPIIVESQPSLPNNHQSILRFRSPIVGEVLGINFRKVIVIKSTLPWRNPVADALSYSKKNLGAYSSDRSISSGETEVVERWIAPPDLIQRMAKGQKIEFGFEYQFSDGEPKAISTIPMPVLMRKLRYPHMGAAKFEYLHGASVQATIENCDAFVTLNIPDPSIPFSRVSITGSRMIVELPGKEPEHISVSEVSTWAADLLGIPAINLFDVTDHRQKYAKIKPIEEHARKDFIYWASTVKGKAFSLGRFACWRPKLLLDDLVKDIRLIDAWIKSGTPGYDQDLHYGRR